MMYAIAPITFSTNSNLVSVCNSLCVLCGCFNIQIVFLRQDRYVEFHNQVCHIAQSVGGGKLI